MQKSCLSIWNQIPVEAIKAKNVKDENMNVIIIGAGASGLVSGIFAAKQGAKVTIIEHENKPGKKILVTGNGKCNITNTNMTEDCFYGDRSFIREVLNEFGYKDTIEFFNSLGMRIKNKNGYIYPAGEQAATVLEILKINAQNLGVKIKTNNNVNSIKYTDSGFVVDIGIELHSDRLIIATGGMAAPKTGSRGLGYPIAKQFGHTIVNVKPALTALIMEKDLLNKASGVRTTANIWLEGKTEDRSLIENEKVINDGNTKYSEKGELQITDYGISGIPVFNLSRMAAKKTRIHIDFLPDNSIDEIVEYWKDIATNNPKAQIGILMDGMLNTKLTGVMLEKAGLKYSKNLCEIRSEEIFKLLGFLKDYVMVVNKARDFDFAQVTAGGVNTDEINSKTMESKKQPGLYFIGEIVDVDGICGGYNLQFAWATGAIAGRNCVK